MHHVNVYNACSASIRISIFIYLLFQKGYDEMMDRMFTFYFLFCDEAFVFCFFNTTRTEQQQPQQQQHRIQVTVDLSPSGSSGSVLVTSALHFHVIRYFLKPSKMNIILVRFYFFHDR